MGILLHVAEVERVWESFRIVGSTDSTRRRGHRER